MPDSFFRDLVFIISPSFVQLSDIMIKTKELFLLFQLACNL